MKQQTTTEPPYTTPEGKQVHYNPAYHTNNQKGFKVKRDVPDCDTEQVRTVKYIPRLTKDELSALIVAYIKGEFGIDEFRLKIKKSRAQAFRIIRKFKDSDEYFNMCGDEWDRMTFSKEFNNSIPATVRYNNLTKVKCQLLSNKGSVTVDESKLKENEYRIIKALNAIHAELSP